jgi:DNA-binding NarL/FixJ family response regulator
MTQKPPLRIAVADDHRLVLAGIRRAFERAPDMEIVAEAMNGEHLLALVEETAPDVVLLDLRMPGGDGLWTLGELRRRNADITVIVLSASENPAHIEQALAMGAASYVSKTINPLDLPSTVRQVIEGTVHHRGVAAAAAPAETAQRAAATPAGLSERELDILRLVAEGLSNQEIASRLYVTGQTVKFHLSNIYRKLGVGNRTEASRFAFRAGVVDPVSAPQELAAAAR